MSLQNFIKQMPKVELHVHLEGSIQPETLLKLAERNNLPLPASSPEEIRSWYTFTNFAHFIEIYFKICDCLRTPEDFELVTVEFLKNQAAQNIRYSEVFFTPYTHHMHVPMDEQLAAINHARVWAGDELGVRMGLVPDVSRQIRPLDHSLLIAEWAVANMGNGIIALGLGGPEIDNPPELFQEAFEIARNAGLPALPHAGETVGADSVWGAVKALGAARIGHGVRCLENPQLVEYLRVHRIPLDVSPTSNVCLGVVPDLVNHPLPRLLDAGLIVTINSDDPPMFGTTLTEEYLRISEVFGFDEVQIVALVMNAVNVSFLPGEEKQFMKDGFQSMFFDLAKICMDI